MIDLLPKFFYFSDYQMLAGETDLNELAERVDSGQLRDDDETMISLLRLAGQEPKSFLDEEYVTRKAELQAASSDLTRQVMKYWKQNDALSVVFDTDMPIVGHTREGHEIRHRFLKVELHDARHDVSTNFSTRSAGFQWFFSFLAAFSAYQDSGERVVVLLDEPGTSLVHRLLAWGLDFDRIRRPHPSQARSPLPSEAPCRRVTPADSPTSSAMRKSILVEMLNLGDRADGKHWPKGRPQTAAKRDEASDRETGLPTVPELVQIAQDFDTISLNIDSLDFSPASFPAASMRPLPGV